ncbi:hypothetical protein C7H62_0530 [Mesoflavibacter sp. HG96]|nr:hypothetical protein C7H62_0530 [Mesoflavibacter sp. HG96]QIJ91067.1 hypothetical protein C7H56_0530 [Mesoflavibacter sp. HG37]
MIRKTDIISINSIEELPSLERIKSIPRERTLKLIFENELKSKREKIGENLKKELLGFQVGIHTIQPEIYVAKLITDEEIESNQDFFEQCAKDYRQLGKELLFKLVNKLNLKLNEDFPLGTFNILKSGKKQIGKVENWKYFVHGFHCGFENITTGQIIEVPLVFGLEFGDLDPYFFTKYIKSTPSYKPLPVDIYEDYADGVRIIEKMISLGKFERIDSNIGNHYGIVVTDREKVNIKSCEELDEQYKKQNRQMKNSKFNIWKYLELKK